MKKIKAVLFTLAAVLLITSNANAGSFLNFSIGNHGHHSGTSVGFSLNLDNHYPTYGYSVQTYTGHHSKKHHYSHRPHHYRGHSHYWSAYNGHDRHHHKSHWKRARHHNHHKHHWKHGRHGHHRGHYGHHRGHHRARNHRGHGHW